MLIIIECETEEMSSVVYCGTMVHSDDVVWCIVVLWCIAMMLCGVLWYYGA